MVKDNPLAPVGVSIGRDNSFWRGRLLLHTMEAQAYWTENEMVLEDSVDTWLSMLRQASDQRTYISPAMSAKWVTHLLCIRAVGPLLTGAKFEQYVHAHGYWSVWNERELHFQIAHLLMHHPDKGDPTLVLEILRRHVESGNQAIYDVLDPKIHGVMGLCS